MSEPSSRKAVRAQRMDRLRKVIREEGAELTNSNLQERFSWTTKHMISQIRKEVGVPAPTSIYLTDKDLAAGSIKVGSRFLPPNQPEQKISSVKDWEKRKREAKERSSKYDK